MVGRVRLPAGADAVLRDDLMWESPDPVVASYLNLVASPKELSPADGDPGMVLLHRAAQALEGQVVEAYPAPPWEPGQVY
jgi:hypothetical protein